MPSGRARKAASAVSSSKRRNPQGKVQRPTVAGFARRSSKVEDQAAASETESAGKPVTMAGQITMDEDSADQTPTPEDTGKQSGDGHGWRSSLTGLFRSRTAVVRMLIAVIVIGTGLAGWLGFATYNMRSNDAARNAALVDAAATQRVTGQVTQAIRTAFSYNFADAAATEREAQNVLVGRAIEQYNQLFTQVKRTAPEQRLVFSTTVRSVGVIQLDGDRARLLVFVDQQGVRADTNERRSGSAQLDVSAQRVGDAWKISDIGVL
jgi:Mce-associated membrane protein